MLLENLQVEPAPPAPSNPLWFQPNKGGSGGSFVLNMFYWANIVKIVLPWSGKPN